MTNNFKQQRYQQRLANLLKAFAQLEKGLAKKNHSDLEKQGIIKSFEFSFELSWKTLKDYFESEGLDIRFPRETIKHGFQKEILKDGETWIEMLEARNLLSHTYDENTALKAYNLIKDKYFLAISQLIEFFNSKNNNTNS